MKWFFFTTISFCHGCLSTKIRSEYTEEITKLVDRIRIDALDREFTCYRSQFRTVGGGIETIFDQWKSTQVSLSLSPRTCSTLYSQPYFVDVDAMDRFLEGLFFVTANLICKETTWLLHFLSQLYTYHDAAIDGIASVVVGRKSCEFRQGNVVFEGNRTIVQRDRNIGTRSEYRNSADSRARCVCVSVG